MAFIAVLAACGKKGPSVCPEGMEPAGQRATPTPAVWCKPADRTTARWIELYADGKTRRASCGFRQGKASGSFVAWHPDGKVWVQGEYEEGAKSGRWTQWDKDGMKVAWGEYRSGSLIQGAPVGMIAQCEKQTVP